MIGTRNDAGECFAAEGAAKADDHRNAGTRGIPASELSLIVRIGWNTPDDLTEDEFTQYSYVMLSFLRRYENVYFQWQSGLVDDDFWIGHRENLLWAFRRPGMQRVWKDRKNAFSIGFQKFLDGSDAIAAQTPETRRI